MQAQMHTCIPYVKTLTLALSDSQLIAGRQEAR